MSNHECVVPLLPSTDRPRSFKRRRGPLIESAMTCSTAGCEGSNLAITVCSCCNCTHHKHKWHKNAENDTRHRDPRR